MKPDHAQFPAICETCEGIVDHTRHVICSACNGYLHADECADRHDCRDEITEMAEYVDDQRKSLGELRDLKAEHDEREYQARRQWEKDETKERRRK